MNEKKNAPTWAEGWTACCFNSLKHRELFGIQKNCPESQIKQGSPHIPFQVPGHGFSAARKSATSWTHRSFSFLPASPEVGFSVWWALQIGLPWPRMCTELHSCFLTGVFSCPLTASWNQWQKLQLKTFWQPILPILTGAVYCNWKNKWIFLLEHRVSTWRQQGIQNVDINYWMYCHVSSLVFQHKTGTAFSPLLMEVVPHSFFRECIPC